MPGSGREVLMLFAPDWPGYEPGQSDRQIDSPEDGQQKGGGATLSMASETRRNLGVHGLIERARP